MSLRKLQECEVALGLIPHPKGGSHYRIICKARRVERYREDVSKALREDELQDCVSSLHHGVSEDLRHLYN